MSEEIKGVSLPAEELERIMALPERSMSISGGLARRGKFDEATNKFYALDDDGHLTGRVFTLIRHEVPPEDQESPVPPEDDTPYEDDDDSDEDSSSENGGIPPHIKKKFFLGAAAVGVLAVIIIFVIALGGRGHSGGSPVANATESPAQEETLDTISVAQVTRTLIPGDEITKDDIQEAKISAETYNQISLSNAQLYQWDRKDSLVGSFASVFIPKGQYLTYSNVDAAYVIPVNPWSSVAPGRTLVKLPITEEFATDKNLTYGAIIDFNIKKETITETATPTPAPTEGEEGSDAPEAQTDIDGMTHEQSVTQSFIVDSYSLKGVTVCDLLDADGNSLYDIYTAWSEIPSGEQASYLKDQFSKDKDLSTKIIPKYIIVQLTEAQSEELGELSVEGVEVTLNVTGNFDATTNEQKAYTAKIKALQETISDLIPKKEEQK